jgi:hypothetical protein
MTVEMLQRKAVDKMKTHILRSIIFFPENSDVYEILCKNFVQPDWPQMNNPIRRMRFACWITKAADTHSECVIYAALPLQH